MIGFINPRSGNQLEAYGDWLIDTRTRKQVARVVHSIPRFVTNDDYAESFGWQWHRWHSTLSDSRNTRAAGHKRSLVLRRTRFDTYELTGKTILECGMGGGDDTEVLLSLPFAEVHAFDLSHAVDRAAQYLTTDRLQLAQASIFEIPYADETFDFVYCHRVLQHTPDPETALRRVARKVKPGGVLFVHSYNKSLHFLMQYKYKLRPVTKRLPPTWVAATLDKLGPSLHRLNRALRSKGAPGRLIAHNLVPFEHIASFSDHEEESLIELEKLVTFDALTPAYDLPMTWSTMKRIVEEEGFRIRFYQAEPTSPLYCTAEKQPIISALNPNRS